MPDDMNRDQKNLVKTVETDKIENIEMVTEVRKKISAAEYCKLPEGPP